LDAEQARTEINGNAQGERIRMKALTPFSLQDARQSEEHAAPSKGANRALCERHLDRPDPRDTLLG
jgi:hypothetical protein